MRRLIEKVHTVAPFDCTVLLLGETGTGKSHLGRLIHSLSPRKSSPFLVIQCGVLSATLIESELFGHARGAFTGADRAHTGRLAAAGAGTVLLDDIDAVPLETQPKLLRVVEDRLFEPLGTSHAESIQARLIATTNGNLDEMVAAGRFLRGPVPSAERRYPDAAPIAGAIRGDPGVGAEASRQLLPGGQSPGSGPVVRSHAGLAGVPLAGKCPRITERLGAGRHFLPPFEDRSRRPPRGGLSVRRFPFPRADPG